MKKERHSYEALERDPSEVGVLFHMWEDPRLIFISWNKAQRKHPTFSWHDIVLPKIGGSAQAILGACLSQL